MGVSSTLQALSPASLLLRTPPGKATTALEELGGERPRGHRPETDLYTLWERGSVRRARRGQSEASAWARATWRGLFEHWLQTDAVPP